MKIKLWHIIYLIFSIFVLYNFFCFLILPLKISDITLKDWVEVMGFTVLVFVVVLGIVFNLNRTIYTNEK
jgi:hypothetical protein